MNVRKLILWIFLTVILICLAICFVAGTRAFLAVSDYVTEHPKEFVAPAESGVFLSRGVMKMTKEEIREALERAGFKFDDLTSEAREKLTAWLELQKAALDTETRRKVRKFYVSVGVVASVACFFLGYWIHGIMG